MFRRLWSGLPADPVFPTDLQGLGYFIHPSDEIRSISSPSDYYMYYVSKSERHNDRRLFSVNAAVRSVVHDRLASLGLRRALLPLGATESDPHVPIFTSGDLSAKSRVVVIFAESSVYLGVLSALGIMRRGGVDRNSAVGLVRRLLAQESTGDDPSPPGVVLANAGELFWWPAGRRGLTHADRFGAPMASAAHLAAEFDERVNGIPGNRTESEHVRYVFEAVLKDEVGGRVDVIAVGDMADVVEGYLNDDETWDRMGGMLGSMVVLGGFYHVNKFKCEGFARFMKERARAYMVDDSPVDSLVAGPSGNPASVAFTSFGCNAYSGGPKCVSADTLLIEAQTPILEWMQRVALEGDGYANPSLEVIGDGGAVPIEQLQKFQESWDAKRGEWKSQDGAEHVGDVHPDGNGEEHGKKDGRKDEGTAIKVEEDTEATKKSGENGTI